VASGNAQAYHAADYYWKGKHPGWAYFTAVPFGLRYVEMTAWINWMGGQELWDQVAGAGQAAKICNTMILGTTMIATCEAFALADDLGLAAKSCLMLSRNHRGIHGR
jgi:TRAP-type mannitol/chloroaromatic compound transport system substrate-binding protein